MGPASRRGIAWNEPSLITRDQVLGTRASRAPQPRKYTELLGTASDTAPIPHLMVKRQRSDDVDLKFSV